MTSARALLRGSATLLAGRAAQAVLGIAILALTTRALDVRGFGDFAAGLAVASLLGGVLNAALSDSYVVSDDVTPSGVDASTQRRTRSTTCARQASWAGAERSATIAASVSADWESSEIRQVRS